MVEEKATFDKIPCPICKQPISKGGAAYVAHLRSHVRKKEAIEYKRGDHLVFLPADSSDFLDKEPYAKLGDEPLPGQPKEVWDITDELAKLTPVNPAEYYVTTGEALKKADKLVKDVYSLAVKVRSFRDKLKKAKGAKKYLETCRENTIGSTGKLRLLIKTKMPRKSNIIDEIGELE